LGVARSADNHSFEFTDSAPRGQTLLFSSTR
jgi:hypothetical protein